ncbi:hypothetical protein PsorP6_002227 [Peronosclerospora sorghi]|uniref:Uncharacterized protein n=1 Tax=Peronosclerospora sorghi TaxID=230839 RepID=A0ACC0WVU0_9STRA|nr:hypothetical protein PsorP6_002227 [Peronosclerospora sorghi]
MTLYCAYISVLATVSDFLTWRRDSSAYVPPGRASSCLRENSANAPSTAFDLRAFTRVSSTLTSVMSRTSSFRRFSTWVFFVSNATIRSCWENGNHAQRGFLQGPVDDNTRLHYSWTCARAEAEQ